MFDDTKERNPHPESRAPVAAHAVAQPVASQANHADPNQIAPNHAAPNDVAPNHVGANHIGMSDARAIVVAVAGWILPGAGHAILKMWGRAATVLLTVAFLVYLGAGMRGNLFTPGGDDAFARLGYVADIGTGGLYFLARSLEATGSDVSHAEGDYGTRFLATAGVLNLLAALHAYEAARRRKA